MNNIRKLEDSAGTLFTEWIDLLTREADEKAIFLFVFIDVLHYVRYSYRHRDSFDSCFTSQLLCDSALLLQR